MRGPVRGKAGIRGDEWPFDMCYDSAVCRHAGLGRASCRPSTPHIISMTHSASDRGDEKEKKMQGEERGKKSVSALSVSGDAVSRWTPTLHTPHHPTLVFAVCTATPCEANPPLAECKASFKTGLDRKCLAYLYICVCVRLCVCRCLARGHMRGAEKARGPRGPRRVLCCAAFSQ